LRQAYDYWQDQPGNYLVETGKPGLKPNCSSPSPPAHFEYQKAFLETSMLNHRRF